MGRARELRQRFVHTIRFTAIRGSFTVTVTHVGSSKRYSEGWENVFSGKKSAKSAAKPVAKKKAAPKKKGQR